MLMHNIKLIVCDLDNTLVAPPHRALPDYTLRVLAELTASGLAFTVATGRSWPSFKPFYDKLPVNAPPVLLNGASLFDPQGETDLMPTPLHPQDALAVLERARESGLHVNCYLHHKLLFEEATPVALHTQAKEGITGHAVGNLAPFMDKRPGKLLLVGEPDKLAAFRKDFIQASDGEGVRLVFSEPDYLEVLHRDANKFAAIQAMCAILGLETDNVLAFGDNENDLEMVGGCGLGVAVATGHPTVKAASDHQCPGPLEEGVAHWLAEAFDLSIK